MAEHRIAIVTKNTANKIGAVIVVYMPIFASTRIGRSANSARSTLHSQHTVAFF